MESTPAYLCALYNLPLLLRGFSTLVHTCLNVSQASEMMPQPPLGGALVLGSQSKPPELQPMPPPAPQSDAAMAGQYVSHMGPILRSEACM